MAEIKKTITPKTTTTTTKTQVKPKKLKLQLSEAVLNIIARSHGDKDAGVQYDEIEMYKYRIMQMLTEDSDLIATLNNEELAGKNGDAYRFVNIYSFLKIPDTQSTVKNFICFDVNDIEQPRYTDGLMKKYLIFRTISHEDDVQTEYGIARQDLLAAIIKSKFDWSQVFGMHLEKVSDHGRVMENGYYYREFVYETTAANNLVNKGRVLSNLKVNPDAGNI